MSLRDNGGLDESSDDRELVRDGILVAARIGAGGLQPVGLDLLATGAVSRHGRRDGARSRGMCYVLCAMCNSEALRASETSQAKTRVMRRSLGKGNREK